MTCTVKCECEYVMGEATLIVDAKTKPQLSYRLQGAFYVAEKGDRLLHCIKCFKPVLTYGEWE